MIYQMITKVQSQNLQVFIFISDSIDLFLTKCSVFIDLCF